MGTKTFLNINEVPVQVLETLQPGPRQRICYLGTYGKDDVYYRKIPFEDYDDGVCEAPAAFYDPKTSECRMASTQAEMDVVYAMVLSNGGFDKEEEYEEWDRDDDDDRDEWEGDWRDYEDDDEDWDDHDADWDDGADDEEDDEEEDHWREDVPPLVYGVLHPLPEQRIYCLGTLGKEEVYYLQSPNIISPAGSPDAPALFYDSKTEKFRPVRTEEEREAVRKLYVLYLLRKCESR